MTNNTRAQAFVNSERMHILMISNHGIHQWNVIPGLPDTGGQNVFVNQFTETLADLGFKITIVNRGGYPHPVTNEMRRGVHYKDEHQRILYLEDEKEGFVRKEDMDEQTPQLAEFLYDFLREEDTDADLIISHYWDGAKVGALFNDMLDEPVDHIWVPHSLGAVKKENVKPERYGPLRIDERIQVEKELVAEDLDAVAATSSRIRESLEDDYGCDRILFLPPCVPVDRYHPREIEPDHSIYTFLSEHTGLSAAEVAERRIVTEISRTDTTKRKDVLIKAFAQVHEAYPDTMLIVSIDDKEEELAAELKQLITEHGIEDVTAAVGYVWDQLPDLYAVTDVYCSPSVMEGFGMTVQEAAATKVPSVGSNLIPFLKEYLLGDETKSLPYEDITVTEGEGAIMVPADEVDGFAFAISRLFSDENLRREMGERAYEITIPYFTWDDMARRFLESIDVAIPETAVAE